MMSAFFIAMNMRLTLPPPLIWLICFLLIRLTASWLPAFRLPYGQAFGLFLLICSALIALLSVFSFYRAKTTFNPTKPENTTALLQNGIFRFSRNPMYLSLVLALSAFTCRLASTAGLIVVLLFTVYLTYFQIIPEEKALTRKFGRQYLDYRRRVRRWI